MISEDSLKLPNSITYIFDEFHLEAENLLLLRNSEVVPLAPKSVEVLLTLIEADGKLITKQQIIEKVWTGTFVEEANLTHHISALRKALGEDKTSRKFIETIPRRGYRFVAEIKNTTDFESAEFIVNDRAVIQIVEKTTITEDNLDVPESNASEKVTHGGRHRNSDTANSGKKSRKYLATAGLIGGIILLALGAWLIGARSRIFQSAEKTTPPEVTVKSLTPDAMIYGTSVSPDGTSVVFASKEKETITLWRKSLATGEMSQLLPTDNKYSPFTLMRFSPDGKWIYYRSSNEAISLECIYRIPANGGIPQIVAEDPWTDFAISHDSKRLAYVKKFKLIIHDLENGNEKVLAESRSGEREFYDLGAVSLAWSPDDRRIVVPSKKANLAAGVTEYLLVEFDVETGAESQIPIPKDFKVRRIEWMPDGNSLLVTHAVNPALPTQIWRVSYPDGAINRLSPQNMSFETISLTADGKKILALEIISHYNLWLAPTSDTGQRKQISVGARAQHGASGLAYLPGGKILYTSPQSGNLDLWTMDETGGDRRQLTVNAGSYNAEPQVTGDKRYIVFVSNRTGTPQIWRMDIDGGNPRQLTANAKETFFQLSPDNQIYLIEVLPENKERRIYKVSVENGERQEVDKRIYADFPTISPDGKWALRPNEDIEKFDLLDTATNKVVRSLKYSTGTPNWWFDSTAVLELDNFTGKLFRIPIDGGTRQTVADFAPETMMKYSLSPDGAKMVFSLGSTTSEAVEIQNLSESGK